MSGIFLNEKTLTSMIFYKPGTIEYGRRRSNELVIILHGWLSAATFTETLARILRDKLGYSTLRLDLSMTFGSMENLMKEVEDQLSLVNWGKDFYKVHILAHSMGGLIGKIILNTWDFPNIGKFITIGTPFLGSRVLKAAGEVSSIVKYTFFYQKADDIIKEAQRPLLKNRKTKIGLIAGNKTYALEDVVTRADYELRIRMLGTSPNDGTVTVESALGLADANDKVIVYKNHLQLIFDPPIKEIGHFLLNGKF
jgi:pimeloyl-ACP methyl ester carboxylesterase